MNRADKILIVVLMLVSLLALIPAFQNTQTGRTAVVRVRNEEIMRIDLSQDGDYTVDGTMGKVNIQVRNGSVAVTEENSPRHICSRQGYVDSVNTPIVCLPNETVITIEGEGSEEDTVIS